MMIIIMMNGGGWCGIIISKIPHYKSCLFTETPNGKLQHFSKVSIQCLQQPSESEILQIWVNIPWLASHRHTVKGTVQQKWKFCSASSMHEPQIVFPVCFFKSPILLCKKQQNMRLEPHEDEKTNLPPKLQLSQLLNHNDAKMSVNCLYAV